MFPWFKKKASPSAQSVDKKIQKGVEVSAALQKRAYDVAEVISQKKIGVEFENRAIALGKAVPCAVNRIAFNGISGGRDDTFYGQMWLRDFSLFEDLASFLAYWLTLHEAGHPPAQGGLPLSEALELAASIYTASERGHNLIKSYREISKNPEDLRIRKILGLYSESSDDECRLVLFAYIVNEALDGPPLTSIGPEAADPVVRFTFQLWLSELSIALFSLYRRDASNEEDISITTYLNSMDEALESAFTKAQQVFGVN